MLPFLDKKKVTQLIVNRKNGKDVELNPEMGGDDDGLKAAAEDILRALESKSASDLAQAFKSAFQICDAMPHDEGGSDEDMA
jgi:hypothetical protein